MVKWLECGESKTNVTNSINAVGYMNLQFGKESVYIYKKLHSARNMFKRNAF